MSDEPRPDRSAPPDPAALDELSRAFSDDESVAVDPVAADVGVDDELFIVEQSPVVDEWDQHLESDDDELAELDEFDAAVDGHDHTPDASGDVADDADDADAQTGAQPGDERVAPSPDQAPEEAPRIIRIGDFSGSHPVARSSADSTPVGASPAETTPAEQPATRPIAADGVEGADDPSDSPAIIEIDDEDLPDAVYIEGSLDGDGSRSIVFIEDDDTGDALKPESERDLRRGIEPRMRERRLAVKRAQGRKRLKWVALAFVLVVIVVGALAVLGSSLFAIKADQVTVTGNVYVDEERLDEIIDDLVGTPVLLADTQAAERELEAIPWVDDARVRTDFPHAVSIELREREAITTYQGPDQRFRVLDREGRVLDVLDGYPLAYLLLGGPDPVDLDPGEFAPRGYAAASELAKNLTGSVRLPNRVEIIEVASDGSRLIMRLNDGTEVRFGEARDLFAKLVRLETVLTSDDEREPGVIDVSTREVTS